MEQIGIVFIILGLISYLIHEDFLAHIWGGVFFSTGALFYLMTLKLKTNLIFSEELVILLYLVLNILLVTGIFIFKDKINSDKVDEIK